MFEASPSSVMLPARPEPIPIDPKTTALVVVRGGLLLLIELDVEQKISDRVVGEPGGPEADMAVAWTKSGQL